MLFLLIFIGVVEFSKHAGVPSQMESNNPRVAESLFVQNFQKVDAKIIGNAVDTHVVCI